MIIYIQMKDIISKIIKAEDTSTWNELTKIPYDERKNWIKTNLPAIEKALEKRGLDEFHLCIVLKT